MKALNLIRRFLYGPLGKPMSVGLDPVRLSNGALGPHDVWVQSLGSVAIDIAALRKNFKVIRRRKILWIIPWEDEFKPGDNDQTEARVILRQTRLMGVVTYTIVETGDQRSYAAILGRMTGWRAKLPLPMKISVQDRTPKV